MLTIKLRKLLVMTIATVLAVAGLIAGTLPAGASGEYAVNVSLLPLEQHPVSGQTTEYEVRVANIGTRVLDNLYVEMSNYRQISEFDIVNPTSPCQKYALQVDGQAQLVEDSVDCFSAKPVIKTDELWNESKSEIIADFVPLENGYEYRFKVSARVAYRVSTLAYGLNVRTRPYRNLGGTTGVSVSQTVTVVDPPKTTLALGVLPKNPDQVITPADPGDLRTTSDIIEFKTFWENVGQNPAWNLRPTLAARYYANGAQGMRYYQEVTCDDNESSPGVCERLTQEKKESETEYSGGFGSSTQSDVRIRLGVLNAGEKLVLSTRMRHAAACTGAASSNILMRAQIGFYQHGVRQGPPEPNIIYRGDRERDIAWVSPKPCPTVPLNVTVSEPSGGKIRANETFSYEVTIENLGAQDISGLDYRKFSAPFIIHDIPGSSSHSWPQIVEDSYRNITYYQKVTCVEGEDFVCPLNEPYVRNHPLDVYGHYIEISPPRHNTLLPAGKKVRFHVEARYDISCLQTLNYPAGTEVPNLKFSPSFYLSQSSSASNGVRPSITFKGGQAVEGQIDRKLFENVPITGALACSHDRPDLRIEITEKDTSPIYAKPSPPYGYPEKKSKEFRVVVKNLGPGEYASHGFKVFVELPRYHGWSVKQYGDTGGGYQGATLIPLVREETEFRIPGYDPSNPDSSTIEFDFTVHAYTSESYRCPSPSTGMSPGHHPVRFVSRLGNSVKHTLSSPTSDFICNDVSVTLAGPTEDIPPAEPVAVHANISVVDGAADLVPYEIRFPLGSISLPEGAFGHDLFAADLPEQLRNIVTCEGTGGWECSQGITGRLVEGVDDLGRKYVSLKGQTAAMQFGQGARITVNGRMGVVSSGSSSYRIRALINAPGDRNKERNYDYQKYPDRTWERYEYSEVSWKVVNRSIPISWKNTVTLNIANPSEVSDLTFTGRHFCPNSGYSTASIAPMTISGSGESRSGQTDPGSQWLKDECQFVSTAPNAPAGFVWTKASSEIEGQVEYTASANPQTQRHTAGPTEPAYLYEFHWELVNAPQILGRPDTPRKIDPCGANNAHYELPENTDQIHWRQNADRSVDAIAQDGYAFTVRHNGVRDVKIIRFNAPADSGALCPTIAVKVAGARAEGSDHQFTVAWKQNTPAATPGATAVTTTTAPGHNTVAATSQAVDTTHGAMGTLSVTTTPVEAFRFYDPTMACYYERPATGAGAGGAATTTKVPIDVVENPSATTSKSWDLNIPTEVGAFPITCETAVAAAFSTVTLNALDGGYTGTAPEGQAAASIGAAMEWSIYPETTPGSFDTSHGTGATFDTNSGVYSFEGLGAGTYYIGLTQAPTGYEADTLGVVGAAGVEKVAANNKDYIKVTVSAGRPMQVTVYGKRQLGSLTFDKISAVDGSLLEGSAWMLTSTEGGNGDGDWAQGVPLTDCVANEAAACTGLDKQPEAGKFHIDALKWGNYELRETQAPVGFRLPENGANGKDFTVQADALTHAFTGGDAITNDHSGVPNIPHTGGLGRDHLLISGMLVLLIAGVATVLLLRTAQQRP